MAGAQNPKDLVAANILRRMSSENEPMPANTPADGDDGESEADEIEQAAQDRFKIWKLRQLASQRASPAERNPATPRYSEATGRFVEPSTESRVGLPRPDRRTPGQWLPVTRQDQPQAFVATEEERQEREGRTAASMARVQATLAAERGASQNKQKKPRAPVLATIDTVEDDEMEMSGEAAEEVDDDETGTYGAPKPAWKPKKGIPSQPPPESDDSIEEEDEDDLANIHWQVGKPQPHPTPYSVPVANGRTELRQIAFRIDFNDPKSVNKANKARRLAVWRSRKEHGIERLLRPSTIGRQYTEENDMYIVNLHDEYAMNNGGKKMPLQQLTDEYNARFPAENRTKSSLSSHIDKISELKSTRTTYDRAADEDESL